MSEEQIKLIPCPFCGGEAKLWADSDYGAEEYRKYSVACTVCTCSLGDFGNDNAGDSIYAFSKEEAIKAWNTRE